MSLRPLTARTITTRQAMHAQLAQVRKQGFVISDGELEDGLRGVAVPVRDPSGRAIAAVSLSLDDSDDEADVRRDIVPPLLTTAARIEADLRLQPGAEQQS